MLTPRSLFTNWLVSVVISWVMNLSPKFFKKCRNSCYVFLHSTGKDTTYNFSSLFPFAFPRGQVLPEERFPTLIWFLSLFPFRKSHFFIFWWVLHNSSAPWAEGNVFIDDEKISCRYERKGTITFHKYSIFFTLTRSNLI